MPSFNLKLFNAAAALAFGAALATSALAADPIYIFKKYTPGVVGAYAFDIRPQSLSFGSLVAGASSTKTVTLANIGASPIGLTSITAATAGFTQTNNCGFLPPNAECQIEATFTPPAAGVYSGSFMVHYDNNRQVTIALSGTGTPADAVGVLGSTSLDFGPVQVGASPALSVSLSNSGGNDLSVSSIASSNPNFAVTQGCTTVVNGTPCAIEVTYSPSTAGEETGTLTVVDNAVGSPRTVALAGTGLTPVMHVSTANLGFGNVNVGTSSTLGVRIDNQGNQDLVIGAAAVSGDPVFAAEQNCSTITPNGYCVSNVSFTPTASGPATGTLSFTTNVSGSSPTVSLAGTGVPAVLIWVPYPSSAYVKWGVLSTYCSSNGWRMPTAAELIALYNSGLVVRGTDGTPITEAGWTDTPYIAITRTTYYYANSTTNMLGACVHY